MAKKRYSKKAKHTISPAMHYTVVIALVISLVTTFLLGMLITETLWGGGLGYFHALRRQIMVERAWAATGQYKSVGEPNRTLYVMPPSVYAPYDPCEYKWEMCSSNCDDMFDVGNFTKQEWLACEKGCDEMRKACYDSMGSGGSSDDDANVNNRKNRGSGSGSGSQDEG